VGAGTTYWLAPCCSKRTGRNRNRTRPVSQTRALRQGPAEEVHLLTEAVLRDGNVARDERDTVLVARIHVRRPVKELVTGCGDTIERLPRGVGRILVPAAIGTHVEASSTCGQPRRRRCLPVVHDGVAQGRLRGREVGR
jgi:hypothetical protein